DAPRILGDQWVAHETDVLELSEEVEKRIRWRAHEHGRSAVGQQLEEPPVRFARARAERDVLRRRGQAPLVVVGRYRLTRGRQAEGLGNVPSAARVTERRDEGFERGDPATRRVRLGEVHEEAPRGPQLSRQRREPVFGAVPTRAYAEARHITRAPPF